MLARTTGASKLNDDDCVYTGGVLTVRMIHRPCLEPSGLLAMVDESETQTVEPDGVP